MLTLLKNWYKNSASHCDPLEFEQATTRLVIGTLFSLFILYTFATNTSLSHGEQIGFYCLVAFEIAAFVLLVVVGKADKKSPARRIIGNWLDVVGTSTFLSLVGRYWSCVNWRLLVGDFWQWLPLWQQIFISFTNYQHLRFYCCHASQPLLGRAPSDCLWLLNHFGCATAICGQAD